jgi:GNAT superfamily N-acetyltransferase
MPRPLVTPRVFPSWRGQGYGDALLAAGLDVLASEGSRTAVVGAHEDDWPLGLVPQARRSRQRPRAAQPVAAPTDDRLPAYPSRAPDRGAYMMIETPTRQRPAPHML